MSFKKTALMGAVFLLAACSQLPTINTPQKLDEWGKAHGFSRAEIKLERAPFALMVLGKADAGVVASTLTVYIEGDGAAWSSPYHPPRDPTPQRPIALLMAAADSALPVVYLARPCQYLEENALSQCSAKWWTGQRFSKEVISAYDHVLDMLLRRHRADQLNLVGFSGGGVIATLLASRRRDVARLVTVAAPLSLGMWTRVHGVSALAGSIDPATLPATPAIRSAVHFVGERDSVVPVSIVQDFVARQGGVLEVEAGFAHECCWAEHWQALQRKWK